MPITTTPLLSIGDDVLMVLKRYELSAPLPLNSARDELERLIAAEKEANATWGYFPEIIDSKHEYQACRQLGQAVEAVIKQDPGLANLPLNLAFVRLATHEPESTFGGFHVDVSPGIAHHWAQDVDRNSNIMRVLFNVHDQPRKLEFYPHTAASLRDGGYDIPIDRYKILEFPGHIKPQVIEIPPIEQRAVYALQFLSNLIPHAGRTYVEGHFLVSFGGYIDGSTKPF